MVVSIFVVISLKVKLINRDRSNKIMGKEPKEKPRCKGKYCYPCPDCNHTGFVAVTRTRICGKCNGRGCKHCVRGWEPYTEYVPCDRCGSLGCVDHLSKSDWDKLEPRNESPRREDN